MKTKIYLLLFLIAAYSCSEDTIDVVGKGTLTGTVIDEVTKEPIAGVKISTNPASSTVFSDNQGEFIITPIDVDDYSVQAELEGFVTAFEAVTINDSKTSNVAFDLAISRLDNLAPVAPNLIAPEDGGQVFGTEAEFIWTSGSTDADDLTYILELRAGSDNTVESYTVNNDTTLTINTLMIGVNYFWQVSVDDSVNPIVRSSINSFSTSSQGSNTYLFTRVTSGNSVIYAGAKAGDEEYSSFQLTSSNFNSFRPRRNRSTGKIAYLRNVGESTQLFTMDFDGQNDMQITSSIPVNGFRLNELDFTWAQNGSKLYYPSFNKLYSINLDGSGLRQIYQTPDGSLISEVSTSDFDDDIIALKTNNNDGYNVRIYTFNLATQAEEDVILENFSGAAGGLDLDANANRLLYSRDTSGSQNSQYRIFESRIFIYDFSTMASTAVDSDVDSGENDIDPRWSPSEGDIILTRVSNNLTAIPSVYSLDIDSNAATAQDQLLFTNASMPDWE